MSMISQHLSNGGVKNVIGNYSDGGLGATVFSLAPPNGVEMDIARILVHVEDTGTFAAEKYGYNVVLTNGITVGIFDDADNLLQDLCDGIPVMHNADWGRMCYDVVESSYGVGNNFLNVRWTFARAGAPLHIPAGKRVGVRVNDDLSGLVGHYFLAQGVY